MDRLRFVRRLLRRVEASQVRRFGHSILSLVFRTPVLVLTTTGKRSGHPRETTVAYLRLADRGLLVVGGAGGQTRLPDWVANLRADPKVLVTVKRKTLPMVATELSGEERERAWSRAVEEWPQIRKYERLAGRPIPVIRLENPR